MKHYVDHLSRELFRYALTISVLLFLLFTIGVVVNLQSSTVGVLKDGAARLSRYWGESVERIDRGVLALANESAVSDGLRVGATEQELAEAYACLYAEVNSWADGSSVVVTDAAGRVLASNLYRENQAKVADPGMVASLRSDAAHSVDGLARQSLWTRLAPPHTGTYVTATRLPAPTGSHEDWLIIGILGESGLIDQVHAQSIERIVVTDQFDTTFLDTASGNSSDASTIGSGKFVYSEPNFLTLTANGVDYFHASRVDPTTGVKITVLAPQRFFWKFAGTSLIVLAVVAVAMVVLARALTLRRSRRSAAALASLDRGIDEWFAGNLDFRLEEPSYAEFSGIYGSFNHLVGELDTQVRDNTALEHSHTALEIRQLETQFNPHFVFNTMEMLRYEIPINPDVASRIVLDLAGLMRYSIRERGNSVRLSEDIAYLDNYLELHKLRLGSAMEYRFDCSSDALDGLIPRLLIQPLVENALVHARPPSGVPLIVTVRAAVDDDVLTVCVEDNGETLSPEEVADIRRSLESADQPQAHLGIFLVNRVVQLIYGADAGYGLRLKSEASGTISRVRIPYEV